jgi:hypothetical protein
MCPPTDVISSSETLMVVDCAWAMPEKEIAASISSPVVNPLREKRIVDLLQWDVVERIRRLLLPFLRPAILFLLI